MLDDDGVAILEFDISRLPQWKPEIRIDPSVFGQDDDYTEPPAPRAHILSLDCWCRPAWNESDEHRRFYDPTVYSGAERRYELADDDRHDPVERDG